MKNIPVATFKIAREFFYANNIADTLEKLLDY